MKIALAFAFLFISNLAFSQSEKEVEEVVLKFQTALLAEDAAELKSHTSTNLNYGHSAGKIENQEEFVAVFEAKNLDYKTWEVSNQTISFHEKDMAIVRQNVKAEIVTVADGTVNSLDMGLLMIWVKEKGEWKLLVRQSFRFPQN